MANTTIISQEEKFLGEYFEELKGYGLVKEIVYQPDPFILSDAVEVELYKQLKTKKSYRFKTVMPQHIYTADFKITWTGPNMFHKDFKHQGIQQFPTFFSHNRVSWIECKGIWDLQNMTRIFVQRTQPWVYQKYGIYINLIKVPDIFKNTFVPARVLPNLYYKMATAKNQKGDKKFKWEYKSFLDYYIKD